MKQLVIIALVLLWCIPASADLGPVYNPANDTWYERIDTRLDWDVAKAAAALRSITTGVEHFGHLAVLTSEAENDWIWANLGGNNLFRHYLGGSQGPEAHGEPGGGWKWVTGEPWVFADWAAGEPNDAGSGEDALSFAWDPVGQPTTAGQWNDLPKAADGWNQGYIVEYPVPEPVSSILFLVGGITLATRHYRKKRK